MGLNCDSADARDLADIRHEGKLTRDEFAVAMHLINTKLAGQDVPTTVPNSLIPPSLREEYGAGSQEVLAGQGPSSVTKDLFDLFDDPPQPVKQAPPPAPDQAPARPPPPQPAPFSPAAFLPPPPSRRSTAQDQRQMSPVPTGQQQSGSGGFGERSPCAVLTFSTRTPKRPPWRRRCDPLVCPRQFRRAGQQTEPALQHHTLPHRSRKRPR